MKRKEKLLDKIVKKDYNDKLEEVLSKKDFSEEVKNILLDMMYKIEISYKDYETVKKNVLPKEQYIENIINIVEKDCNKISLIKPNSKNQTSKFEVKKEEKEIICYPITNKLLYCLAKIQKSEDILKQDTPILNKTFTDMVNIGNNINIVEPLRDFNGYSWNISVLDIENFYYNLIYQDLIILSDNTLIDEWTCKHNNMIDYADLFNERLQKKYGKKLAKETIQLLENISVLLELYTDNSFRKNILERKKVAEKEIKAMENKEKYLEDISNQKKELEKKIKQIDIILNNKELLAKEYEKRNENLPLDKKIFSKRVLKNKMQEERYDLIMQLQKYNDKMNSKKFLQVQKRLKEEQRYLSLVDEPDYEKKALEYIIMLQNRTLKAIRIKISQAKERQEILKIMYEIRYFNNIPIDTNKKIGQIPKLKKSLELAEKEAFEKAYELKAMTEIVKNKEINFKILQNIFSLNIIKIEDICIKIIKEKDNSVYIQYYDDNVEDELVKPNFEIKKQDLKIRFNKKALLFI